MFLIFTDFYQCMWLLEYLWINIIAILLNFQSSSSVSCTKYNCAVLFLKEMYWLFICAFKYFLTHHHCKTLDRMYWFQRKWQNLLNFLYYAKAKRVEQSTTNERFSSNFIQKPSVTEFSYHMKVFIHQHVLKKCNHLHLACCSKSKSLLLKFTLSIKRLLCIIQKEYFEKYWRFQFEWLNEFEFEWNAPFLMCLGLLKWRHISFNSAEVFTVLWRNSERQ